MPRDYKSSYHVRQNIVIVMVACTKNVGAKIPYLFVSEHKDTRLRPILITMYIA